MSKKYRKKPIVIEAMQLTKISADTVINWIGEDNLSISRNIGKFIQTPCFINIKSLEGVMNLARFLNGGLVYDVNEKDKNGTYKTEFQRRCDKETHKAISQSIRLILNYGK